MADHVKQLEFGVSKQVVAAQRGNPESTHRVEGAALCKNFRSSSSVILGSYQKASLCLRRSKFGELAMSDWPFTTPKCVWTAGSMNEAFLRRRKVDDSCTGEKLQDVLMPTFVFLLSTPCPRPQRLSLTSVWEMGECASPQRIAVHPSPFTFHRQISLESG